MAEYKCINCGEIKGSATPDRCPICGYKMFPMPFNRKKVLISEINGFISSIEVIKIARKELVFKGKEKGTQRFPDYERVVRYVTSFTHTEDFQKSLHRTVEQLRSYYTSPFSKIYPVSFEQVYRHIERNDSILRDAIRVIAPETVVELRSVDFGSVSLTYTEKPDQCLWLPANKLLGLLEKLVDKIVKFIKTNNLYGDEHKYYPKTKNAVAEVVDYKAELESAAAATEKILAKKYIIDIMDDGIPELEEMITCLWRGLEIVMHSPLFAESYNYITTEGSYSEEEYFNHVSEKLAARYSQLNTALQSEVVLADKSEEELFEYYKALILLDSFDFFTPAVTTYLNIGESEKKLNDMIGLSGIKESVRKIKAYAIANRGSKNLNIHMCFLGNPGTGKTEVARYIAGILFENQVLPENKVIEVDRSGLVSQYFGATAEKTSRVIAKAMGGVLFIDEAYALGNNSESGIADYGKEAIDTLVKAMEDHRGDFCVVFAGYRNEMKKMLSVNPGLQSRIQFVLDFPNYTRDELKCISELMLSRRKYSISDAAMRRILDISDIKRKEPNFANAREIRNILDHVIMCQNLRCLGSEDKEIGLADVNKYIQGAKIHLPAAFGSEDEKALNGEEELAQLIGLTNVKRMVRKIKAYAKRNKNSTDFNLHMCFCGNPGTGKTEVARIMSRLLYEAGVLGEAKLVETDSRGVIGKFVGETASKTEEKIDEAMNGVLFIDEAYSLIGTDSGSIANYGSEAIAVLLKDMEDYRGHFCVILAGYRKEMQELLLTNPGFASRIQFVLDFPDYTREELRELAVAFLKKKDYEIENDALTRLMDITDYYRQRKNFANARTVRNILDQVILNQNLRTENNANDALITLEDVNDYILDERIDFAASASKRAIGFSLE